MKKQVSKTSMREQLWRGSPQNISRSIVRRAFGAAERPLSAVKAQLLVEIAAALRSERSERNQPAVDGWYWVRWLPGQELRVCRFTRSNDGGPDSGFRGWDMVSGLPYEIVEMCKNPEDLQD